jgi:hypothetical protein
LVRVFWLAIFGGVMLGLWLFFGWSRARKRRKLNAAEVQKLLALAAKEGTLTEAMIQAAMDVPKADAAAALADLRDAGLGEAGLDENGAEVFRVNQSAVDARKNKGL